MTFRYSNVHDGTGKAKSNYKGKANRRKQIKIRNRNVAPGIKISFKGNEIE